MWYSSYTIDQLRCQDNSEQKANHVAQLTEDNKMLPGYLHIACKLGEDIKKQGTYDFTDESVCCNMETSNPHLTQFPVECLKWKRVFKKYADETDSWVDFRKHQWMY
jgi:hypothetical protein